MARTCKLYVGNLGNYASELELQETFAEFGKIAAVFVAKRPPGFAFIEYENAEDAEAAEKSMNGEWLFDRQIRVELSHGRSRWPGGHPPRHLLSRPAPRTVASPPRELSGQEDGLRTPGRTVELEWEEPPRPLIPVGRKRKRRATNDSFQDYYDRQSNNSSTTAAILQIVIDDGSGRTSATPIDVQLLPTTTKRRRRGRQWTTEFEQADDEEEEEETKPVAIYRRRQQQLHVDLDDE